jgi:hypothetical protein
LATVSWVSFRSSSCFNLFLACGFTCAVIYYRDDSNRTREPVMVDHQSDFIKQVQEANRLFVCQVISHIAKLNLWSWDLSHVGVLLCLRVAGGVVSSFNSLMLISKTSVLFCGKTKKAERSTYREIYSVH